MSACTLALLEVERGSERKIQKALKALPGVVLVVDRIRDPTGFSSGSHPLRGKRCLTSTGCSG